MTSAALTVNKEWNTKLISTENGEVAEEIVEEFHNLWNSEYALPYDDFYDIYKERYRVRPDELAILSKLLQSEQIELADFKEEYRRTFGFEIHFHYLSQGRESE